MASLNETVDVPITLHVSKRAQEALVQSATASGMDLAGYVSAMVERSVLKPLLLEEISGPIHQKFVESGMTDDELGDRLEEEKHTARTERRARGTP